MVFGVNPVRTFQLDMMAWDVTMRMKQNPLLCGHWFVCLIVLRALTVLLSAAGIIVPWFIFHVRIAS